MIVKFKHASSLRSRDFMNKGLSFNTELILLSYLSLDVWKYTKTFFYLVFVANIYRSNSNQIMSLKIFLLITLFQFFDLLSKTTNFLVEFVLFSDLQI